QRPAQSYAFRNRVGIQLHAPPRFPNRFFRTARDQENVGQPQVSFRQVRIQIQGSAVLSFGIPPVPIVKRQERGERIVSLGEIVVQLQGGGDACPPFRIGFATGYKS